MLQSRTTPSNNREMAERAIIERCWKSQQKFQVIPVPDAPRLADIPNGVVTMGSFSWFVERKYGKPYKLVFTRYAREIADGVWCTPPQAARAYLDYKFPSLPLRARGGQLQRCLTPRRSPPLYATVMDGDLVYIDIKSAYWSILQVSGYDVQYSPGDYFGVREKVSDFPYPDWKLARNSLVSVGQSRVVRQYSANTHAYRTEPRPNRFTNRILWALVNDTLNAIAVDAVSAGAVYVYTDGYIFRRRDADRGHDTIARWGLKPETRYSGYGYVRAPGCYRVGDHFTRVRDRLKPFSKLRPNQDVGWLRERFSHFAKQTDFVYS